MKVYLAFNPNLYLSLALCQGFKLATFASSLNPCRTAAPQQTQHID